MTMSGPQPSSGGLPVSGNLRLSYAVSLVVALLMAGLSVTGLAARAAVYPTEELQRTFVANDVVNLALGLPVLLLSMLWARRGRLLGLLFWPGALFYVVYNYLVYALAMPLGAAFLLHLTLLALSLYALAGLLSRIDGPAVQGRLRSRVPERLAGGALAGLGGLFLLRTLGVMVGALLDRTALPATEKALLTTDFLINPAWIIGGVMLWRQQASGYVLGLGLLFQGSLLFVGLIVFLLLQPLLTGASFAPLDVIVTAALSLVCLVPFALFARGAASA